MKTVAIVNRSCGSGRTELTKRLSSRLQAKEKVRVLIVDLNSPLIGGNISSQFLTQDQLRFSQASILEALTISHTQPHRISPTLDLFIGNDRLDQVEEWFARQADQENILRIFFETWGATKGYDYALVDCCARFDSLTKNAIVAADYVLVPKGVRRSVADDAEMNASLSIEEAQRIRSQRSLATEGRYIPVTRPLDELTENDWNILTDLVAAA